ncbi:AI-2E family transporter [Bradyrhizobium sp.]|uniref:AI-2E family transporter n=1 Tax=Bradyrhizobium sp. TaxID=376 RepID=UPI0026111406|nr:AI-2E family transporter [Bradyrhizobium sp.]
MEMPAQIKLTQPRGATLINMGVAALIIAGLYFGREIFVPVALAVLLSFVLAPFVSRLQSFRLPRVAAVLAVVILGFAIIFSLGGLMVTQASKLAEALPGYETTLRNKIETLRGIAGGGTGTLQRASEVLNDLKTELQSTKAGSPSNTPVLQQPVDSKPIPVEVRQPDPGALSTLVAIIAPLVSPLTTTGIVVIFVIFILIQRQDLRNRFVRLAGSDDIQRTTAALDEAGERLSRLFLTQIAFNAAFGVAIGIGLQLIGVPSAPLWGLVAMILRFVPYIGAFISAIFPLILAAAVGSGWEMLLLTMVLFVILELLASQVLEPVIFGHSSGLSPIAIIVAASFWTWLWGPVGLVLATPLTICLVVVGRHVDRLQFLDIMLGDQPALTPMQLVYQRMLAGDPIEAVEQAREYLKTAPLVNYYDTILTGGLGLAAADNRLGHLDAERLDRITATVSELVDDLDGHEDVQVVEAPSSNSDSPLATLVDAKSDEDETSTPPVWQAPRSILCIPGFSKLDEAAAIVLAQLLRRRGYTASAEQYDAMSVAKFFSLDLTGTKLVCICYADRPSGAKLHYAVRRLTKKTKSAYVMALFLGRAAEELEKVLPGLSATTKTFATALDAVEQKARETSAASEVAADGVRAAPSVAG